MVLFQRVWVRKGINSFSDELRLDKIPSLVQITFSVLTVSKIIYVIKINRHESNTEQEKEMQASVCAQVVQSL